MPSSTSCPSPPEPPAGRLAVITCGALTGHVRDIAGRRAWPVEVHSLPALLHNRPALIAPAARELALELRARGLRVALAYADCGSYGALDELCGELGIRRLAGLHCYDVFGGQDRIRAMLEADPGTYLLTDFLIRSFRSASAIASKSNGSSGHNATSAVALSSQAMIPSRMTGVSTASSLLPRSASIRPRMVATERSGSATALSTRSSKALSADWLSRA